MALLFMDGFDVGDYTVKYDAYTSSMVSSVTTTRFSSGRSLSIARNIAAAGWVRKYFPATAETYVGMALMPTSLGSVFMRTYGDNSSTIHIGLYVKSNGSIEVLRGSTSIVISSAGLISAGKWYYIETKIVLHSSTGNVIVKVNGQEVINFTGNTKNGGTASTLDTLELGRADPDGTNYYDDLYICDNTGAAPYNTFLNEVRLHTLSPTATGSSTQFTPSSGANYTTVDEIPFSATDYVSSGTAGHRDTYQLTDLPVASGNVLAVQNNIIAKKTDAANIALKSALKSGATVYYGADTFLGASDGIIRDIRTTDPDTSVSWTASGVNSLEAGFEVA